MAGLVYEISRTYEQVRILRTEYKNVKKGFEDMNRYLLILKAHEDKLISSKNVSLEVRRDLYAQRDRAQSALSEYFTNIRQLGYRRDEVLELQYREELARVSAEITEIENAYQEIANDNSWYQKSEIPNPYKNVTLKEILRFFTKIEHQHYLRMNELDEIIRSATNQVQIHSIVRLTRGEEQRIVFIVRKECSHHAVPENFLLCPVENLIGKLIYGKELGHEFIFPNSEGKWKIEQIDLPLDAQVQSGPDIRNFGLEPHSWLIDSWR